MGVLPERDLQLMQKAPVVIVADTETTGLSPDKGASLLEIGAVKLDVVNKKILGSFSHMIRPLMSQGRVPAKITEITGITNADVAEAAEQEEVMDHFWHFVYNLPIVFHNATFDWRFLSRAFHGIGVNPVNEVLDTMTISKALLPSLRSHSLAALSEYYGHPIEGHHRAVVDAKYTASIYLKMVDEVSDQMLIGEMKEPEKILIYNPQNLRVYRVRYWESGRRQRVYVTTSAGVFYYDINRKTWAVSDLRLEGISLDCQKCGQQILSILGESLSEFISNHAA